MDKINPGGVATFDGHMSAFRDRGGKFITFHGRNDPASPSLSHRLSILTHPADCQYIASGNSKRVYDLISRTLRMPSLDTFYRLFLIPGMGHCAFGPGATRFGSVSILSSLSSPSQWTAR
jgi:feruloyl esterase